MSIVGKYKLTTSENFEEFMKVSIYLQLAKQNLTKPGVQYKNKFVKLAKPVKLMFPLLNRL